MPRCKVWSGRNSRRVDSIGAQHRRFSKGSLPLNEPDLSWRSLEAPIGHPARSSDRAMGSWNFGPEDRSGTDDQPPNCRPDSSKLRKARKIVLEARERANKLIAKADAVPHSASGSCMLRRYSPSATEPAHRVPSVMASKERRLAATYIDCRLARRVFVASALKRQNAARTA